MIASEMLAAWLGDRAGRNRSRARSEAFAAEWGEAASIREVERDLTRTGRPSPEAVVASARRFFDRAAHIDSLLQALIDQARADPFFVPPMSPMSSDIHSGLLLFHHDELSIGMGVTGVDALSAKKAHRRNRASVGLTGHWDLFRFVKSGRATISFWEAEPIGAGFSAAHARPCRRTGARRMADGEEILIDGSRESFIIDHAESDILYLHARVRTGAAPLAAEYDSDTRSFIGATSTDEAGSRVQMMATLLREMDRDDAVPVLRESLASPHFYTRWHIMRELLALDAEAALPDLRRMAAWDPHPEVRTAAAQTLRLFFDDAPAERELEACRA